jgi:hypothetical protein
MDRIQELIGALADKEVILRGRLAKASGMCKICNKPATFFRTPFSELEYSISAICQDCQDYYFMNHGQS